MLFNNIDLRKGSEKDDSILGKFTPLLEFQGAQFPSCKDVICHYLYKLQSKPKNQRKAKAAAWETAKNVIKIWRPSCIPLMTKINIQKKVMKLANEYKKHKSAKNINPTISKFKERLLLKFLIISQNAENIIIKNKILMPDEKEEDLKFVERLKLNLPVSLGPLDRKTTKQIKKKADLKGRLLSEKVRIIK